MKRAILVVLCLVLTWGAFAAIAQAEGEWLGTITWFTSQEKLTEGFKAMVDAFEKREHIKIELQIVPETQYHVMVKTKLATGDVPDVFSHNAPQQYIAVNAKETCVDLSGQPWVARLANADMMRDAEGAIYGMPREIASCYFGAYYNVAVAKQLGLTEEDLNPKTFEDFKNLLRKAKEKGVTPMYFTDAAPNVLQLYPTTALAVMMSNEDPDCFKKIRANEAKWTDYSSFKRCLEQWMDLYSEGLVNEDHSSATYDMMKEAFGTNQFLLTIEGEWFVNDVIAKFPGIEIGSFAIPFDDLDMTAISNFSGDSVYVPKDGKQVDFTLEFLNKWSQPESWAAYYGETPGIPAYVDVDGGTVPAAVQNIVDKYVKTGKYVVEFNSTIDDLSAIVPDLWNAYADMLNGGISSDEVIQEFQNKYEEYMTAKGYEEFT